MDGKLLGEVLEGVKAVGRIETLLILPVATLHLAVVSWRVGTDEFMPDAQLGSGDLKQGGQIPSAVGETIGKLKAIVRLHALYPDTSAGVPLEQLFEEISRRKGVLLRIGSQESQAGKLINSGYTETGAVLGQQCTCGAPPSRPPEHADLDRSSARKALVYTLFSSKQQETAQVCA